MTDRHPIALRAIHLDLKGHPPTPERLLALLDIFALARYNAILVEWEDCFPWHFNPNLQGPSAYSPDTVHAFHDKAARLGLEIIPLVQCLGHLETPLTLPEYQHLREHPLGPGSIHPLHPESRPLIESMIDEVLDASPSLRYFHLGGDESRHLGQAPDTRAYAERHGLAALYLHHVQPLLEKLIERGIRPILWHDMMLDWEDQPIRQLAQKTDICFWGYNGHPMHIDPQRRFHIDKLQRFADLGVTLWGATAAKGAEGPDANLCKWENRLGNAEGWYETAQKIGIDHIISTTWSRYNTIGLQVNPTDAALDTIVAVGLTLADTPPHERSPEACRRLLETLQWQGKSEGRRFQDCHDAMDALEAWAKRANLYVRMAWQMIALGQTDPRRQGGLRGSARWYSYLRSQLQAFDAIQTQVLQAFESLTDPRWMHEHLEPRKAFYEKQLQLLADEIPRHEPEAAEEIITNGLVI